MKAKRYCPMCQIELTCTVTRSTKETGRTYRMRRFTCSLCGWYELVFADGTIDDMGFKNTKQNK